MVPSIPLPAHRRGREPPCRMVIGDEFSVTQHVQRLATYVERTDKLRAASIALPRTEQRRSAARLPRHRRLSSDERRQRMAPYASDTARRIYRRSMNCAMLQIMNCSVKPFDCQTTYCTHYYTTIIHRLTTL